MTDELQTDADRDPQKEGGRVQPGDGHALAEKARERAMADEDDATGSTDDGDAGDAGGAGGSGGSGGSVSSVQNMDEADADTPISDSQSVAGQPDGESGRTDEGPTGPNSRGGADRN